MNKNLEILRKLNLQPKRVSGNGEVLVKCPLHHDTSPSLAINIYTGKFHCFSGCIKGNSIKELAFKLTGETIKEDEGLWLESFRRKILYKQESGNTLPSIPSLPLAINNRGEDYLASRGFIPETIKQWNLQWWEKENAVVVPIKGIGYIFRYLQGEKKYKYAPGSKISNTLFGVEHYFSLDNSAILVEGAFDCIWLHQNGFNNALAILGSNLSDEQLMLLKGICLKVYIMMDGDKGGRSTTNEISKQLKRDFIVGVCELPEDKDPNTLSKDEIQNILMNTKRRF